jgi:hypothetical protein
VAPKQKMAFASAWMIGATVLMNLSMVAYHRVMSGALGDHYAELAALTGVVNVLGVVTLGISTYLVKVFSRDVELKGPGAAKGRLRRLKNRALLFLAGSVVVLAPAGLWFKGYLGLNSYWPYALVVALFLGSFILLVARAAVQGLHHFVSLGNSLALEGIGRVVMGAALVWHGVGVAGALIGSFLAQGLGLAAVWPGLKKLDPAVEPPPAEADQLSSRKRFFEMAGDTLALTLLSVICFLDVIVIKHSYLDDVSRASLYSRAALVAKSFLYLASALNMVLLPAVAAARAGGRDTRGILYKFLAVSAVIEFAGLAFVWAFTDLTVRLLCGGDPRFYQIAPLVRIFSLAVIPLALFQLTLFYHLAMRRQAVVWLVAVAAAVYYFLLHLVYANEVHVVMSLGGVSLLLLICSMALVFKDKGPGGEFDEQVSPLPME